MLVTGPRWCAVNAAGRWRMRRELRLRAGLVPRHWPGLARATRWQAGSTAGHSVPEDRRGAAVARPDAVRTEHWATVCFSGVTDAYVSRCPAWSGGVRCALTLVAGCRRCRQRCRRLRPFPRRSHSSARAPRWQATPTAGRSAPEDRCGAAVARPAPRAGSLVEYLYAACIQARNSGKCLPHPLRSWRRSATVALRGHERNGCGRLPVVGARTRIASCLAMYIRQPYSHLTRTGNVRTL
jgi:hypothetical protein